MPPRCLDLTDRAARDPVKTGAKAAGLAAAHAAGLPVLPGVVVPVGEAWPVVEAVTRALTSGNDAQARLAALDVEPDPELLSELEERLASFSEPLIVRSSSPLEGDGTWSGAFSSFHGIRRDELWTAIRGCWGAAFSFGVLDRARHTGTEPDQLGLAVLIQPELHPDLGGLARMRSDGSVRITATSGPLLPLMAGDVEGQVAVVGPGGEASSADIGDTGLLKEVAALSRRVAEVLDHHTIEWLAVDGAVYLLQSLSSGPVPVGAVERAAVDHVFQSDVARRIAALALHFPGRLAEALILPWAVAGERPEMHRQPTRAAGQAEAVAALAAAQAGASCLTTRLWGGSPRGAADTAERVLRQLRSDDPAAAMEAVSGLARPEAALVTEVMENLAVVLAHLTRSGIVDSEATFWRMSPEAVDHALLRRVAPAEQRLGVERWEPFVHSVVAAVGDHVQGTPAAPGAGAGRAFIFDGAAPPTAPPAGRYVIVASQPAQALSSLLWNAAGLATRAGSTAAHLIEFAHSIGVPTVVGCELPQFTSTQRPPSIAVDGDSGMVAYAWLE
jgi:hypothetical protein